MEREGRDDKRWEVLRSEYVVRDKHLTVRRDHIRQPGGVEIPGYWVLEYPEWVNVIAVTPGGLHVVERQYRHGLGNTHYEICAGCVDEGETPLAAARRELWEETGYGGGTWEEILTVAPNSSAMTNTTHCFVARGVEKIGEPHREPTEDIDVELKTEAEVLSLLLGQHIVQACMAAPLWKYFATKGIPPQTDAGRDSPCGAALA